MNQPYVKMLNRIADIENAVLKGLVLDEHGAWIPIADKKAMEEDFCAHLEAGEVLHEGRWISIEEAKRAGSRPEAPQAIAVIELKQEPPPAPAVGGTGEQQTDASPGEETNLVTEPYAPDPASPFREDSEYAPETRTIPVMQPPAAFEKAPIPVEPVSEYAPETGLFAPEKTAPSDSPARDRGAAASAELYADSPAPTEKSTTVLLPSISSWELDTTARRKKILIIGIAAAVLAGIGALAIILVQVAR